MSFEEYAALARQLAEHRRAGERNAAAETERRRHLQAGVDYLHQRLTAQGQRLDQLGRAVGVAPPPPGPPAGPGPDTTNAGPGRGTVDAGGAAAAPGRPGVGAYPQVTAGQTRLAMPAAGTPMAAGIPTPRAVVADPVAQLELARRHADEVDRHAHQVELLAQRPILLPTWSTLARAVAVYAGCAAGGVGLMLILVLASGVGVVDLGTLYAWMCAGLPAASLIAGFLVLGRWGRPAAVAVTPPRHVLLGFLICFVLLPLTYCAYLLVVRGLR